MDNNKQPYQEGTIKEMFKVGDIIQVIEEQDYGYVFKIDERFFWIYWFSDGEERRYKKDINLYSFLKVS